MIQSSDISNVSGKNERANLECPFVFLAMTHDSSNNRLFSDFVRAVIGSWDIWCWEGAKPNNQYFEKWCHYSINEKSSKPYQMWTIWNYGMAFSSYHQNCYIDRQTASECCHSYVTWSMYTSKKKKVEIAWNPQHIVNNYSKCRGKNTEFLDYDVFTRCNNCSMFGSLKYFSVNW